MRSGRISWVDIARGIGIILVIYGHTLSANSYRYVIYSFHMPLFFFLSGLVFSFNKYNLKTTFGKSVKGLLLPYIFFAFLSYLFWISNNGFSWLTPEAVLNHLGDIVYGNSSSLFFNIVLWFLPCLFAAKMGFAVLTKYVKSTEFITFSLILLSILGFLLEVFYPSIKLPFGLESAVTAIVFFGFASLYKTRLSKGSFSKIGKISIKYSIPLLLFFGSLCFVAATISFNIYGQQVDTRLNHLNNYFLFYIASISGIIFCLILSKIISKNFILEYIGRNTLVLFALHPILFFYFGQILNFDAIQNIVGDASSREMSFAYTIAVIPLILIISKTSKSIKPFFSRF